MQFDPEHLRIVKKVREDSRHRQYREAVLMILIVIVGFASLLVWTAFISQLVRH